MTDTDRTNEELLDAFAKVWLMAGMVQWRGIAEHLACDEASAAVLARMAPGWQPIASAPRDGRLIRVARHMGDWGWILGTSRWVNERGIAGWLSRGTGEPADGLGLGALTHWAPFDPPLPSPVSGRTDNG